MTIAVVAPSKLGIGNPYWQAVVLRLILELQVDAKVFGEVVSGGINDSNPLFPLNDVSH